MIFRISFNISVDFFAPVFFISGWPYETAAVMHMLETVIYEDNSFIFRKYDIWTPRKFSYIFSVPKTTGKQILANNFFRLGICTSDM